MNANLNLKSLDIKNLKAAILKLYKRFGGHLVFAAVILVLLSYVIVVLKISALTKAEPDPGQTTTTSSLIPHVNQQALDRIQSLENNNAQLHSLFENARNNPFQE